MSKKSSVITESSEHLLVPIFYDVTHKVCIRVPNSATNLMTRYPVA